ncbi:metallophosphoesterase [Paenibacillus chartarius]|uniref:Metallophosphoesterase n=1 Tax=Paenibacillus chartarius TaxID=747481 RepID=A0ABV6DKU7_9BACL
MSPAAELFVVLAGLLAAGLLAYLLLILPTKWLKVERVRLPLGLQVKILQLSDLHIEKLRIRPERIAALIQSEHPDMVVVTGDFTQKSIYLPKLRPYLQVLQESNVPVYAVLGNHDHHMRKLQPLLQMLQKHGIRVLRNENVRLDRFQLIGIDDFGSGKSRIAPSFAGVTDDLTRIVITHDPNIAPKISNRYDYVMAGHLHGKQFNIPYFFKLRPMGKLPAMGIYKGLHRTPWGTIYISKGLGQTGINIRLFVRSEATVHEL